MDKRAWGIAVGGTVALLAIAGFMCLEPVSAALNHVPLHVGRDGLAEILYMVAWSAALFVMPGVVTVVAVRRPFLCGTVPAVVVFVSDLAYVALRDINNLHDVVALIQSLANLTYFRSVPLAVFVLGWLISSGIGLRVRRRMHEAGAVGRDSGAADAVDGVS